MDVQVRRLANGEVQISGAARRADTGQAKPARVTAAVRTDGALDVDVACIQGKGCDQIVGDLARAVGGEVVSSSRKPDYFQGGVGSSSIRERRRV
jgi:hypothetical protein